MHRQIKTDREFCSFYSSMACVLKIDTIYYIYRKNETVKTGSFIFISYFYFLFFISYEDDAVNVMRYPFPENKLFDNK